MYQISPSDVHISKFSPSDFPSDLLSTSYWNDTEMAKEKEYKIFGKKHDNKFAKNICQIAPSQRNIWKYFGQMLSFKFSSLLRGPFPLSLSLNRSISLLIYYGTTSLHLKDEFYNIISLFSTFLLTYHTLPPLTYPFNIC